MLLAVVLVLVAIPGAATAKPSHFTEAASLSSGFSVRGTHGYRISVSAFPPSYRQQTPNVFITAIRGSQESVTYAARGADTKAGAITAKLPGVGRIAVQFVEKEVSRQAVPENCKGRASVIRHGIFRGAVQIDGEQGFTKVNRHSAPGTITQTFRQVCRQPRESGAGNPAVKEDSLIAGGEEGGRFFDLTVYRVDLGSKYGGPLISYLATSSIRHHGFFTLSSTVAVGRDPAGFLTPDPPGVLENATVEPPSPFHGSATFHLESPTTASWTGTLGVELPGVGEVALAGAGFWSALCREGRCTKTVPATVHLSSLISSGPATAFELLASRAG